MNAESFRAEVKKTAVLWGWALVWTLSINGAVLGGGVLSLKATSTTGMEFVGWCIVGTTICYWSGCGMRASGKRIWSQLREDVTKMRQTIKEARGRV